MAFPESDLAKVRRWTATVDRLLAETDAGPSCIFWG